MGEMIERVAKAAYEATRPLWLRKDGFNAKPWDVPEPGDEEYRNEWREMARAAIAAMLTDETAFLNSLNDTLTLGDTALAKIMIAQHREALK